MFVFAYANGYGNCNSYPDAYRNGDAYSNAYTDQDCNAYADCNTNPVLGYVLRRVEQHWLVCGTQRMSWRRVCAIRDN